jgi:hypothetical protein
LIAGVRKSRHLRAHTFAPLTSITGRFKWLVENGLELLGTEKGGATLEGKVTYRALPPHYHALKAQMNA